MLLTYITAVGVQCYTVIVAIVVVVVVVLTARSPRLSMQIYVTSCSGRRGGNRHWLEDFEVQYSTLPSQRRWTLRSA